MLAVVLRFVDGWEIVQRLVRLEFLVKSLSGEEVAQELIDILSVSFQKKKSSKTTYYAGIMLDALAHLLCSKLCWHNWPRPTQQLPLEHFTSGLRYWFLLLWLN